MNESPESNVAARLRGCGESLATAESCTGGLIAHRLTNLPGSSGWFLGGVVSYSNELKQCLLGVPGEMLIAHGAVSEPVAKAMVAGLLEKTHADWGVGVTGIAGPGGGSPEKPVGLVYIATGRAGDILVTRHVFSGDRLDIKQQTADAALRQLLERFPK